MLYSTAAFKQTGLRFVTTEDGGIDSALLHSGEIRLKLAKLSGSIIYIHPAIIVKQQ